MKKLALLCSALIACAAVKQYEPDTLMRKESWASLHSYSSDTMIDELPTVHEVKRYPHTKVPVLMYHEIGEPGEYGERYTVSPQMFRKHLEWLDKKGFGLIGIHDYITGKYKEYERKPVLLTFDDSTAGQFRYKGREIDPDCAVGILKDYSSKHPGFGHKAAFFIDFVDKQRNFQVPFGEKGKEKQKLEHILELGMEIGNHTLLHTDMKRGKDTRNSVLFCDYLIELIAPQGKRYFAYPNGSMPEHRMADFDAVFAAWGGIAQDIESKGFDRYAIPRVEINNDFRNLEAYLK